MKIIKLSTIILLIAIITIASIFGIYKLKDYKIRSILPEYLLGMEFTESRVIDLAADTTEKEIIYDKDGNEIIDKEDGVEYTEENGYKIIKGKVNSDYILTSENYKKTKSILKNRLKKLDVDQYKVMLDESNGNLQIKIPENKDTDTVIYNLLESGTFEVKDSETEEILIGADKFEKAKVVYLQNQEEGTTVVFLQVKFDKEGTKKLEEISKIYIETTTEKTNENGEKEQVKEEKTVGIYYNENLMGNITLDKLVENKKLMIGLGSGTDMGTLQQYAKQAEEMAAILNSGILPIKYTETNHTEIANITDKQKNIAMYVAIAVIAIMVVISVIILKTRGTLVAILEIGYIALLLLILRLTNVKITIEGIFGILLADILNYIYICKLFKNIDFIRDVTKKYAVKLIPIYIIAILLSFNSIANIYSIGMTLVWGIIIMYLYNFALTKTVIDTIKE